MQWDERNENLLKGNQRKSIDYANTQLKNAKHKRHLCIFFSIPSIVIPLLLSISNNVVIDKILCFILIQYH
jgi:hypothetical protein